MFGKSNKDKATIGASSAPKKQVEVRTYKNQKDFQKDAQKRMNSGWTMENTTAVPGYKHPAGKMFTSLLAEKDKTTVVWVKEP